MSSGSSRRRPDWTALAIPVVIGAVFVAFYASIVSAPPIDRVFVTPLMIVGCVLLAIVSWGEISRMRSPDGTSEGAEEAPIARPWRMVGFIAMMGLYLFGLNYIGFFVSSFAMLVAGMLWFGERNPVQILLISICIIAVEYLLFAEVLDIPFPESAIGLF
jgi:hypothetical protein